MATAVLQEHQRTPRRRSAYTFKSGAATQADNSVKTVSGGQISNGLRSTRRRQIASQVEEPNNNNNINNNNGHGKNDGERGKKSLCKERQTSRARMHAAYQPWVIRTYGDSAKTKTVTLRKYSRILRALRGEEANQADSSKFRFWVKAKGFHVGAPEGYEPKPADAIVGRYGLDDAPGCEKPKGAGKDPPLYVPNVAAKGSQPTASSYRKVAVVENFFDIIYSVHVDLEGRCGKHAGQKRTYRTITETYAFLPREAVTRFLMGCTDCQRSPRSISPSTNILSTPPATPPPSILPLSELPQTVTPCEKVQPNRPPIASKNFKEEHRRMRAPEATSPAAEPLHSSGSKRKCETDNKVEEKPKVLVAARHPLDVSNLVANDAPMDLSTGEGPSKKRARIDSVKSEQSETAGAPWSPKRLVSAFPLRASTPIALPPPPLLPNESSLDYYNFPVTAAFLRHARSLNFGMGLGYGTGQDGLPSGAHLDRYETMSTTEQADNNDNDQYTGLMKEADKVKLMLLAWNYHTQAQARGTLDSDTTNAAPQISVNDVAGLWASYHSALGLSKSSPPREQSSPILLGGEAGSAHDETSSSGHKDDEEASEDEAEELRIDALAHDPERLKAFNMFVRLFVDENLDRMVPISKQPKEKIQAIIDSCTRQFPEFAERARKRIRTYLKSCRRNKKCRDGGAAWDASVRPTPAHLTSVQAEQILAQACENESHNAKRMRVGLEPVSQPMPVTTSMSTETTVAPSLTLYPTLKTDESPLTSLSVGYATPTSTTPIAVSSAPKPLAINPADLKSSIGSTPSSLLNGLSSSSSTGSATPTSLYRPNFTQAFQRVSSAPGNTVTSAVNTVNTAAAYAGALFPAQSFNSGLLTNGPTDLSMKSRPLLSHKLSASEMGAVRQLITGYRESAAFLLRSADELEALLLQQ